MLIGFYRMNILHICTYYTRSRLYSKILEGIAKVGYRQLVFVPCLSRSDKGRNAVAIDGVKYFYPIILKSWHRLFYFQKIRTSYLRLIKWLDNEDRPDISHAHSLYSDGGVALRLKKKREIPYIVAVRGTDVNQFFKKMLHLRSYGLEILKESNSIIFINKINKDKVFNNYIPKHLKCELELKSHILPNGIDSYYHENRGVPKSLNHNKIRFLYVGNFSPNKNVPFLIEAVFNYAKRHSNVEIELILVGGGGITGTGRGETDAEVRGAVSNYILDNFQINIVGRIDDVSELCKIYRLADVFIMISKRETFGLAYIEAMSQGTPIIYTKDQGVSPFFGYSEVGAAVDCTSISSITAGIENVVENYDNMSERAVFLSKDFEWNKIIKHYYYCYKYE